MPDSRGRLGTNLLKHPSFAIGRWRRRLDVRLNSAHRHVRRLRLYGSIVWRRYSMVVCARIEWPQTGAGEYVPTAIRYAPLFFGHWRRPICAVQPIGIRSAASGDRSITAVRFSTVFLPAFHFSPMRFDAASHFPAETK